LGMQLKEQSYSQCSSFACSCEFIQPARGLDRVWINAIYQERLRHQVFYSSLILRIQLYTSLFSNHFGNILGKYDLMHMSAFTWWVSVKPGLWTGLDAGLGWTDQSNCKHKGNTRSTPAPSECVSDVEQPD